MRELDDSLPKFPSEEAIRGSARWKSRVYAGNKRITLRYARIESESFFAVEIYNGPTMLSQIKFMYYESCIFCIEGLMEALALETALRALKIGD